MKCELGMRNEKLGMPSTRPRQMDRGVGWKFLLPNSYFLIGRVGGWR